MFDWNAFLIRLEQYPPHSHRILPASSCEQIEEVEKEFGKLPTTLKDMMRHFNGAELFISGIPYVSIFRISAAFPLPPLEWAAEWYVDTFTRKWRAENSNRQNDWAIAMTNYGGLVLFDTDETIKEWDTSQHAWLSRNVPFEEWIENIFGEGEATMDET